jgi:hypothetical protein
MKAAIPVVIAIATAVGTIASCMKEADKHPPIVIVNPASNTPVPQPQKPSDEPRPSVIQPATSEAPAVPVNSKEERRNSTGSQLITSSPYLIDQSIAAYKRIVAINENPVSGDNGIAHNKRLSDANERVMYANQISMNTDMLLQAVSTNPELNLVIKEGLRLREYQIFLESLLLQASK